MFCDPSYGNGGYLPPMKMYFHLGVRDIVLFKKWIPEERTQYVLSFFIIVIAGIVLQGFRTLKLSLESHWCRQIVNAPSDNVNGEKSTKFSKLRPPIARNACRGLMTGIQNTLVLVSGASCRSHCLFGIRINVDRDDV